MEKIMDNVTGTHTPGPWIVCVNSLDDSLSVEQDGEVITESDPVIVVGCVDDMGDGLSRETGEANARLIAAAPDLLAACENLIELAVTGAKELAKGINGGVSEETDDADGLPAGWEVRTRIEQARAAIAKAKGTP
jgi:hypothetical protein